MSDRSTLLLEHHLKELKLSSFLREYGKMAAQCAAENGDHPEYLLRLAELELIDRHQRMVERRIRAARFPAVKSLDMCPVLPLHLFVRDPLGRLPGGGFSWMSRFAVWVPRSLAGNPILPKPSFS